MYHTWSKHRGEVLEIAKVERKKTWRNFTFFYKTEKKQDRQDYEPNSSYSMQASIDIYLHERGYMHSVRKSRKFASSKAVLEGKARVIHEDGKGRRPNKTSGFVLSSLLSS